MLAQSVFDKTCSHKYIECGPVNAICDCDVDDQFNCLTDGNCMCDATQRRFEVTHGTVQTVGLESFLTVCDLLTGNKIYIR